MEAKAETWCDTDSHRDFECFEDFNVWLDSDEGLQRCTDYGIENLSQRSKALFAGDKLSYDLAFKQYRTERRHEALNERYITEQYGDDHWFERNISRFDQLVEKIEAGEVVPFVGAGLSVAGGFPSWKDHLKQQAKTAGLNEGDVEELLNQGSYEEVLQRIENQLGVDVVTQEILDVFSKTGRLTETTFLLSELFRDTIITTNYDKLIEKAFDTGVDKPYQIISGINAMEPPDPECVTIIKLHGDIKTPARCILSKNQYNQAYGNDEIDNSLPIPKLLDYYYRNSSLLFLGCSLNNDRTVHVFKAIKEKYGDDWDGPRHYSIEQAPEAIEVLRQRNADLAGLGVTAIWFEKGQFEYVDAVLRLARNEIRYREAATVSDD
jgi:NAD-dependent SIR2 family protein deacetylase